MLDDIGFVWDVIDFQWNEGFKYLKEYQEKYGNCLVPTSYKTDKENFLLGRWIGRQRSNKINLSKERISRLESINGWKW